MRKKLFFTLILIFIYIISFSKVGIFYSDTSKNFYTEQVYNAILDGLYEALEFGKIDYTVLKIQELSNEIPHDIDVLILPSNAALKEEEVEMIEKYILRGGKIFGAYEDGLRYSNGKLRPDYSFGSYLGIKYKCWAKGDFNYIKLSEKGKKIFGRDLPDYIKMPRGFTFVFKICDAECLGLWTKDEKGTLSTDSEDACAIALGNSGIFFGENIYLLASNSDIFKKMIINAIRYLEGLGPVKIDFVKIKTEKLMSYLKKIERNLKESKDRLALETYNELFGELQKAFSEISQNNLDINLESKYVQTRAIWLDHGAIAKTGSPENLREIIRYLANIGFNMLIPEVIYKGTTISSKLSGYDQAEEFSNWKEDPLDVIIDEAHKLGIEVHAWIWVFAIAHGNVESPLMKKHPEWLEKDKYGNIFTSNMTAWLSHANDDARNFVKKQILELIDEYELDGINLDYIRYDGDQMGFDKIAVEKFEKEFNISPFDIEPFTEEEVKWQLWREELVTSFVREIYQAIKSKNPKILISADVFPRLSGARMNKKQNWENWAKNHFVDILIPMNYTSSIEDLEIVLDTQKRYKSYVYLYPGIQMISLKNTEDLMKQISTVLSNEFPGIVLFSLAYINKFNYDRLKVGYFRNKAVTPHSDLTSVFENFSREFVETISKFREGDCITQQEEQEFLKRWNEIKKNLNKSDINDLFYKLIKLKREIPNVIKNQIVAIKFVDKIYELIDILRPKLYAKSRVGKPLIIADKPKEMIVIKNPVRIPKMNVKFTEHPIKIDGEMEDIWQKVNWSSKFVTYDTGEEYKYSTRVKVLYDEKNLYVLFDCYEPDMKNVQIKSGKRDTRVYLGDSVEIFIWPNELKKEYFHFVVSLDGTIYDEINFDSRWNGRVKVATKKLKDRWLAEIGIDISNLVSTKEFRANFNRNRWRGKSAEYSGWSCTYGSFHNIQRFGYLTLLKEDR